MPEPELVTRPDRAFGRMPGRAPLAGALALVLMAPLLAPAPTAAEPVFVPQDTYDMKPGRHYRISDASFDVYFENPGTNPRYTAAVFSTTEYYDEAYLSTRGGEYSGIYITVKSNADLNALASPPPSTFTVDLTVTMENDEGETASGTVTFSTTYTRLAATPAPAPAPQPTFKTSSEPSDAPPGVIVGGRAFETFENAGTNPRFTGASFSTMEYYDAASTGVQGHGALWVKAKTAAELNALASPPPSPFTVDVTVTMENDEGQSASGVWTFETEYDREDAAAPAASQPQPTYVDRGVLKLVPDGAFYIAADLLFANYGTNPKLTGVAFSDAEYLHPASGLTAIGVLRTRVKTVAQLNALPVPPPSTFTFTADVTMENDEGQTATGTLTFETTYAREAPAAPEPTYQPQNAVISAPNGQRVTVAPGDLFDDAGTNPRFTDLDLFFPPYFSGFGIEAGTGHVWVKVATDEALSALGGMAPETSFSTNAGVTMENDEGQTARGTIVFETTYEKVVVPAPDPSQPHPEPTFKSSLGPFNAPPGVTVGISASELFDNAGTNPRFTGASFSTTEYYDDANTGVRSYGALWVKARTAAELNALPVPVPPPSPFTVDVTVTMENDEGLTATGTLTFETTYARAE